MTSRRRADEGFDDILQISGWFCSVTIGLIEIRDFPRELRVGYSWPAKKVFKVKNKQREFFYRGFVFQHTTKTAVLYHNRSSFKVQGVCILNQF